MSAATSNVEVAFIMSGHSMEVYTRTHSRGDRDRMLRIAAWPQLPSTFGLWALVPGLSLAPTIARLRSRIPCSLQHDGG